MATDRKDLDRQIEKVFRQCGIEPERAATGRELLELIQVENARCYDPGA